MKKREFKYAYYLTYSTQDSQRTNFNSITIELNFKIKTMKDVYKVSEMIASEHYLDSKKILIYSWNRIKLS